MQLSFEWFKCIKVSVVSECLLVIDQCMYICLFCITVQLNMWLYIEDRSIYFDNYVDEGLFWCVMSINDSHRFFFSQNRPQISRTSWNIIYTVCHIFIFFKCFFSYIVYVLLLCVVMSLAMASLNFNILFLYMPSSTSKIFDAKCEFWLRYSKPILPYLLKCFYSQRV